MFGIKNVGTQLIHGAFGKSDKPKIPTNLTKDSSIKDLVLYSYGDSKNKTLNKQLFGKGALAQHLHGKKPLNKGDIHPTIQRLFERGENNDPIFSINEGIGLQGVLFRTAKKDIGTGKYHTSYKVVFRGTDSKQDIIVEDAGKRGTRQAERAKQIYRKFFTQESNIIAKYNKAKGREEIGYHSLIFAGHSLGGYLANSVMIDYLGSPTSYGTIKPKEVKAETYNALGVTTGELANYNKNIIKDGKLTKWVKDKNVEVSSTNFRMAYDPVSKIGVQPGQVKEMKLKQKSLGDKAGVLKGKPHLMVNFYRDIELDKTYQDKPSFIDKHITDNPITKNILETAYNFVAGKPKQDDEETKASIRYAKADREQKHIDNKQGLQNGNGANMNSQLDELSMKIFKTLKHEIALEYARKG
jgi:hypothetical protein